MELYTLDRKFLRQDPVDKFHSAIWTERYYGDGEVELLAPATKEKIQILKEGTFLSLVGSNEIMILETSNIEEGILKVNGISLLKWLNNRFVRTSNLHEDRYWHISGAPVGHMLWFIVQQMCVEGQFLDGTIPTGIDNPQNLKIPGLGYGGHDASGANVALAVPFGPIYDALKEIATTYQVGMQIYLQEATEAGYSLKFRSYRGLDRTNTQSENAVVRLSPTMDTLTGIKELNSISNYKTLVYSFAPSNPEGWATTPGKSTLVGVNPGEFTGFDLRALQIFCDDLTTDVVGSAAALLSVLNERARDALTDHPYVRVVDGEVVPSEQFQFGLHYYLGDIVELEGNSGLVQRARITEYIRIQDDSGEKAYPTVAVIE